MECWCYYIVSKLLTYYPGYTLYFIIEKVGKFVLVPKSESQRKRKRDGTQNSLKQFRKQDCTKKNNFKCNENTWMPRASSDYPSMSAKIRPLKLCIYFARVPDGQTGTLAGRWIGAHRAAPHWSSSHHPHPHGGSVWPRCPSPLPPPLHRRSHPRHHHRLHFFHLLACRPPSLCWCPQWSPGLLFLR